jgi:hypothetical protein
MRLHKRLGALETKGGGDLPHVVLWGAGWSFDDCLARSAPHKDASSRLLIELACVDGEPLTPEQLADRAKAYAWAGELEAA